MAAIDKRTGIHAQKGAFGSDNSDAGQALLTALVNFITPLIQGYMMTGDKSYTPGPGAPIGEDLTKSTDDTLCSKSGVTNKGQILLDALKSFTASFANSPWQLPENPDQDHCSAADKEWDMDVWESSGLGCIEFWLDKEWNMDMWRSSGLNLIVPEHVSQLENWTDARINRAREMVFNHMPIRLLKFDWHGKGITLVERSQVMEWISAEIIAKTSKYASDDKTAFEDYAILSHTWLSKGEITYSDCAGSTMHIDTTSPGYNKLTKFCEAAAKQGLRLAWMDTVCINKDSSTELDESIRSMFKWYQNAKVCIVYLAETASLKDLKKDRWFTRGWTLQELLAPEKISFYSQHWKVLGNKNGQSFDTNLILSEICAATGLEKEELLHSPHSIVSVPIWRKMQWAANRKVTREEDTAYSLMGIFDVSMPTGYGEGAWHAFMRLVREILNSELTSISKLEIANWGVNATRQFRYTPGKFSMLIPSGPVVYQHTPYTSNIHFYPAPSPITLSYMGLCVPVLLMPSHADKSHFNDTFTPVGDYSAIFHSQPKRSGEVYKILDSALFQNSTSDFDTASQNSTSESDFDTVSKKSTQNLAVTMAVLNNW